jgi:hypothetical protein
VPEPCRVGEGIVALYGNTYFSENWRLGIVELGKNGTWFALRVFAARLAIQRRGVALNILQVGFHMILCPLLGKENEWSVMLDYLG